MTTWYQETPNQTYYEVWKNKLFTYMSDACKCLAEDYIEILEYFPIEEITIKFVNISVDDNRDIIIDKVLE